MFNSWFSSASSRRSQPRQRLSSSPPAPGDTEHRRSDASSVSQSTVGPLRSPANLTSTSDAPLDEVHKHINDPGIHAPTPSLIHSTEKEAGTLRTSDVPTSLLDTTAYQRDNTQNIKQPPGSKDTQGAVFTPQDVIVAQVFGKSVPLVSNPANATPPLSSAAPQPSVSLQMTSDSSPPLPSTQTVPSTGTRPGPTLTIYEPFSGAKLGEHTPVSPSTASPGGPSSPVPPPTSDDSKLWSSLERILGLQAEIATMHAEMESVSGRGLGNVHTGSMTGVGAAEGDNVGPRKRSRRGQTLPVGDEEPEEAEPEGVATGGAISEISTDHSDGGDDDGDDDDGDDDENIHKNGKRRRDEEFARLAEQFAQRKVAIGRIMGKLDDLSTTLKTFHTLPAPLFDLATPPSRTDTMSSTPSNVSVTYSLPRHTYAGHSSPSLLPISPSQVVKPVTAPPGSLTPPIPPMSTLAHPAFSGDPSGPPGAGVIVTPALSRIALPTIIPGAPHVESPAEMNPPLHRVPRGR